ncbi:hypothetical protein JK635_15170 [Neobacillus sp. YIM B02564]|uniref:Uncharacterized protein n=1 Tax=Neobacillus paridis TaxID=2803862 RepID=A0ABS1TSJ2_9BACI|nr:hypothetical protein [Neobacillus paridis]MBL4953533.1 hypothetical protein [Neobacillus paridis]
MNTIYKAAFLVPASAKKKLDDLGWEFETKDRLPSELVEVLVRYFGLGFKENYVNTDVYVGKGVKMIVFKDDCGLIEQIYFQLFDGNVEKLRNVSVFKSFKNVELFIP